MTTEPRPSPEGEAVSLVTSDQQSERVGETGFSNRTGLVLRLLLGVPLICFGAIFAFFGVLLLSRGPDLGGILLGIAAIFLAVAAGVMTAKSPGVLGVFVTAGVLLTMLGLVISNMRMPLK